MTVTVTLQVPFLTAFRVVPDTRHVLREVALTVMLTFDPVTIFSPVYVAIDFADRVFFTVSIGLVAGVVEATGTELDTVGVVTATVGIVKPTGTELDTVDVVTIGQIPPVFTTVSF